VKVPTAAVKAVAVVVVVGLACGLAARSAALNRPSADTAVSPGTYTLKATLTSSATVPKAKRAAGAKGAFTGTLTVGDAGNTTLKWRLSYSKLTGPALAAHIHLGAKSQAGRIAVPLCAPCKPGQRGTYSKKIRAASLAAITTGKAYVNVHTKTNPNGEIRGQLTAKGGGGSSTNPYANIKVAVTPALVSAGKAASEKYSCEGCHTLDGTQSTGPTWKCLAGKKVKLTNGKTVVATDGYLIQSILEPDVEIVAGYSGGVMTTAVGNIGLAASKAITAYIKSLKC
jgi:hypothetical protein